MLDTPDKVEAVRQRLEAVGVVEPHIEAEIQPYSLHHGVGPAKWATRKCETCHTGDSRLGERFTLSSYVPGGILPKAVGDSEVELTGYLQVGDGQLTYRPSARGRRSTSLDTIAGRGSMRWAVCRFWPWFWA